MTEEKPKEEKSPEPTPEPKVETAAPVEKEQETPEEPDGKEAVPEAKTPEEKPEPIPEKEGEKVPQKEDEKVPEKADSDESVKGPTEPVPEKKEPAPKEEPASRVDEESPKKVVEKPKGPKKTLAVPPSTLLLFGKYDVSEVVVRDAGLARYINLDPVSVPHSGAKHANKPFAKGKVHIVERLVNNMMRTGRVTGKKTKTYKVVMRAFEIIGSKTKKNPVQILIEAIENCTPREEVTRLRYGGVSVPKAVDTSSSRRLDIALRNISKGTVSATHKNTKPVEVCLANEIMLAAKGDMNSYAVSKKDELERIAGSAR